MTTSKPYRAAERGISYPASEDAVTRIEAGEATPEDWVDVEPGEVLPSEPPAEVLRELRRRKLVTRKPAEKVSSDD